MPGLEPRLSGLSELVVLKDADSPWMQSGADLIHSFVSARSWQANEQLVGSRARLPFGLRFEFF
jgi:hypothetical protein